MLLLDEDITVSTPGPRMGSGAVPEVSPMTSLPWSSRGERVQVGQSRPVQLAPAPEPRRSPEPLRAFSGEGRGAAAFRRTELPETAAAVFDRGYATAEAPPAETPPLRVYVGAQDPQERRTRMPIVSRIWDMNTVEDGEEEDSTASVPARAEESDDSRRAFLRRGPEPASRPAAFERGGRWTPGRPDLTVAENLESNSGPIHAVEAPSEEVSGKIPPSFALPRPSYTGSSDQDLFGGPTRRPSEAPSAPTPPVAAAPAAPAFEAPAEEKTSKIPIPAALAAEAEAARVAKAAAVKPAVKPAEVAESGFPVVAQVAVVLVFIILAAVAYPRIQNVDLGSFLRRSPAPAAAPAVEPPPLAVAPAPVPVPVEAAAAASVAPVAAAEVVSPAPVVPPEVVEPAPPEVAPAPAPTPAPAPAPAPAAVAVAANPADANTGLLTITADVPARVVIDGVDRGATPVTNLRLSAGTHTVEVKPVANKGRAKVRNVRVDAGRPKTVEFGLQKTK